MKNRLKIVLTLLSIIILTACQAPKKGNQYLLSSHYSTQNIIQTKQSNRILAVSRVNATNPYKTTKMGYSRKTNLVEYYTVNSWIMPPTAMIQNLFVQALIQSGLYKDVLTLPSDLNSDHRLDLTILTMRQYFSDNQSYVKLSIQARLINSKNKTIYFSNIYNETENALSLDAKGGVEAYNRALDRIINQILIDTQYINNY